MPTKQRLVSGRYRLIEPLGRGGMGRVYRAHDDLLDRPVAVKLIYDDAISERDLRRACAVEARAAARLSHPGIVHILDSGFDDGHCFVVMELAEGQALAQIIRESGWLSVERALGLAAQIADALEEAHRHGVIHCDIKPGNLVVDRFERVRLVDFGIARVTDSSTGVTEQDIHGSAKYVAPEQVEGGEIDTRTDLYALGVVLFEMLTGRPPFTGDNLASILAQRLVADPPSVRGVQPTIPAEVDRIVCRAMARDPDQRYQSAGELRDALGAVRDALQSTERLPLVQVVAPPSRRDSRPGSIQTRTTAVVRWAGPWLAQTLRQVGSWAETARPRPARLRTPRWASLPAALGMVALLGLVTGVAATQCGPIGSSSERGLVAEPAEASPLSAVAPAPTEPPAAPTLAATTEPTIAPTAPTPAPTIHSTVAPTVAPTEPPTPPRPTSTAPPPPTEEPPPPTQQPPPEPTAPVAAPVPAAPPVRALRAPPASAPAPAPKPEAAPRAAPADEKPEKQEANDPKPTTPPSAEKPEAPKPTTQPPTLRSTFPDPVPRPNVRPEIPAATSTSSLPRPTPKPQGPPPAQIKPTGSQPTTPPPTLNPQGPPPVQMRPAGSQPIPTPTARPSNGNTRRGEESAPRR